MIVEFFGPPAAGKTTLAVALAERLNEGGFDVQLRLSSRPGEESLGRMGDGRHASRSPLGLTARRLLRPAYELTVAAMQSSTDRCDGHYSDLLARELARGQILRFLRIKQYLIRLANAWTRAMRKKEICIFDQGYIQIIATIMLYQPDLSDAELVALADMAPKSDLVIFVDTSVDEIETRLVQRRRMLGRMGWLFEDDLGAVRRRALAAAHLDALLNQSGRKVLSIRSGDDASLDRCIRCVEGAIRDLAFACGASTG